MISERVLVQTFQIVHLQLLTEIIIYRKLARLREDTHKKSVFFSGRTTKDLTPLH